MKQVYCLNEACKADLTGMTLQVKKVPLSLVVRPSVWAICPFCGQHQKPVELPQ